MNTAVSQDPVAVLDNVGPCDHVMHIYENDGVFLDTLEGFVSGGLRGGETVVVIATSPHLYALEYRLKARDHDIDALRQTRHYIAMDAAEALSRFMVDGQPDDALFHASIATVIDQAQQGGQRVRAFGEMVALLWANGMHSGTVRLEHLWNTLCRDKGLSLFCAYPRSGSVQDSIESMAEIRALHSHVVATGNNVRG